MKVKLLVILFVFIIGLGQQVFALQDTPESKHYFEAVINLQSIEKYFTGEPIYLSKDEKLKDNLRKKIKKIIDYMKDYQRANPKDPEVLFYLGKTYSYAHDLGMAGALQNSVGCLNRVIDMQPNNSLARLIQAKNYMDNREYSKALAEYEYVNKIEPHGQALRFMAIAKMYLKRTEEAKKDLKEYLQYNPNDTYAKNMLNAIEPEQVQY